MTETGASGRIEAHVWRIASVVVLGSIMSILDTTIVNVALETLGRDLHTTLADIQWVITGLHALARRGDPGHRLGRAALRREARLPASRSSSSPRARRSAASPTPPTS